MKITEHRRIVFFGDYKEQECEK